MCAAIVALVVPSLATAQAVPVTEPCPLETARHDFEDGLRFFRDRRYAESATALEHSMCRPFPVVHYNLALAYQALNRRLDAIAEFEACLQGYRAASPPDPDATDERMQAIEGAVRDLRAQVVQIVVTTVDPSSATLRIDDRQQASHGPFTDDSPLRLDPGHHVITWSSPDHDVVRWDEDFGPGDRLRRAVALRWQQDGRLVVEPSVETATVSVDGQRMGRGHFESGALPPGTHTVDIAASGYLPFHRTVNVLHSGVVRIDATLTHRGLPGWVLPVSVVAGIVVAGATIGGVVAATASGTRPLFNAPWGRVIEHQKGRP